MSEEKKVVLTGIKPTGEPHLGNYFGAIKPALELAQDYYARYFIADYHALNALKDPQLMKQYSLSIAATWLACGLDPDKVIFYRQSQVPEIFELTTFLMAFTAKGLMNRAHAYKAAVDENEKDGQPSDHQINMGLFTYPILMAADILLFDTQIVPVGRDQKQHIEMAADIGQAVNHCYQKSLFVIPEPYFQDNQELVVGLDGRKMSKSYHNIIPLFASPTQLKKLVNGIVTNSQGVEEKKDPNSCSIFTLYKLFTTSVQQQELADRYRAGGMGWGYAKTQLFEVMRTFLEPMRQRYEDLMSRPDDIYDLLNKGRLKVQRIAQQKMHLLHETIGMVHV